MFDIVLIHTVNVSIYTYVIYGIVCAAYICYYNAVRYIIINTPFAKHNCGTSSRIGQAIPSRLIATHLILQFAVPFINRILSIYTLNANKILRTVYTLRVRVVVRASFCAQIFVKKIIQKYSIRLNKNALPFMGTIVSDVLAKTTIEIYY